MALRYTNLPVTYKWPIQFYIAGVDKPETFIAEFNRLPGTRIKEIIDLVKASAKVSDEDEAPFDEIEMLMEILASWDAKDGNGDPIPFEEKILREITVAVPGFPGEVMAAFITSTYKGKVKNSKAP